MNIFSLLTNEQKTELYLDWLNNFLTVDRFCEYYAVEFDAAYTFLAEMRKEFYK